MTESKREQCGEEQVRGADVMMLAVSAELDRGMEGQRDRGEDEIFMRSSCWGEAGRPASRAP